MIARDDVLQSTFSACEGKLNDQAAQWIAPNSHPTYTTPSMRSSEWLAVNAPPSQHDIPAVPLVAVRSTSEPMLSGNMKSIIERYILPTQLRSGGSDGVLLGRGRSQGESPVLSSLLSREVRSPISPGVFLGSELA